MSVRLCVDVDARAKCRTFCLLNFTLMGKSYCSNPLTIASTHEKFDVWPGPNARLKTSDFPASQPYREKYGIHLLLLINT